MNFYSLSEKHKIIFIENSVGNRGKCIKHTSGMCGDIYILDQGKNTFPRYVCAKIPKPSNKESNEEIARRFIREMKLQLSFNHNTYVHWAFYFDEIAGVPVASFRYWGNDLDKVIKENKASHITKISLILYTCIGLKHCYNKGLVSHQDLKPANIFVRNLKNDFKDLPNLDIYNLALVGDFGLANAFLDYNLFDGSRPYMAPEQWNEEKLSSATDVFALGVILYELLSSGYHPVGIKLTEFWPIAKSGNTKKWTKQKDWKKWIDLKCPINIIPEKIDKNINSFIQQMLSIEPTERPDIDIVIIFLFKQIETECKDSYNQIKFLIEHFEKDSSTLELKDRKPYLQNKWEKFELTFE
jgi:serine/threonine protein kinase